MSDLYLWLYILIVFSLIVLAIIVAIRNWRSSLNRAYFYVCFSIGGWILVNYFSNDLSISSGQALLMNKFVLFFGGIVAIAMVNFITIIRGGNGVFARSRRLIGLVGILGFMCALTPWVAENVNRQQHVYAIHFGFLAPFYFILLVVSIFTGLSILVGGVRTSVGLQRERLSTILASLFLMAIVLVATNVLVPTLTGSFALTNIGPLASLFLVAGFLYSMIKHRLFDIRFIVARAVGYVLAIFSLGMLYALIAYIVFDRLFFTSHTLSGVQKISFVLMAVGLSFIFQPIKRFFDKVTNRIFFKDAYDAQSLMDSLNKLFVTTIDLGRLLDQVIILLQTSIKSEFCIFNIHENKLVKSNSVDASKHELDRQSSLLVHRTLLNNDERIIVTDYLEEEESELRDYLQKHKISVIAHLPLSVDRRHNNFSYMALGQKKSGNPYTTQDIKTLNIISNELVIAIQNSLRFEEIQEFNLNLQKKIDDATKELRRNNEKLKALDEAKDDFISMASHQLRTPLTSVKGYLSMVLEGDAGSVSETQRQLLTQAFVSSQRMVFLIADLLNVSRLKTGKFIIEAAPSNLADVIAEEVSQLQETAKSRGLELIYKKPDDFPVYMIDETKIRQVIMNFMDNAIYYTPQGGHINVMLTDKDESVNFEVIDDGIGVPKIEQHHLFTKFYRARNAKKARPDGTGLGLFMARKVIVAQGGSIIFNSHEGKGSTFGFTFPKKKITPTKKIQSNVKDPQKAVTK